MRQLISAALLTLLAGSALAQAPDRDYAGQYRLADGRILTVTDTDGKLTAQIARQAPTSQQRSNSPREFALTEVAPDRFKASTSPLQITFNNGAGGDVAQVTLHEQATPLLARR